MDTGLEYKATKEHLNYLEKRYNITIIKEKAIKSIPVCCKEYGKPFFNKYVSSMIERLQKVNFEWVDEPFEVLYARYPNTKSALRWWCNKNKESFKKASESENYRPSRFDIDYYYGLKEFLIENPPTFRISNKCCEYAKKKVAHEVLTKGKYDLDIIGVRKSEGGIRAASYKNCYSRNDDKIDQYRPLFWFTDADKKEYERAFDIKHSDCYAKYGFARTGCSCCPYAKDLEYELGQVRIFEPMMYKAVNNIFGESYEYRRKFWQFRKEWKDKEAGKRPRHKLF
jgi:3'-phosphoadenosine 5'-phosphosulfate sulfotransferase (PAPS reductase)/FAD synthetase